MSIQLTNSTFELKITPNKRKRETLKDNQYYHGANKENNFIYNNFMEVKSISDLIRTKNNCSVESECGAAVSNCSNPFEVVRKPPKKKNRKDLSDDGCFVNPALNLNVPEKVLNPFEVKRATICLPETTQHCFENTGLNIRGEERQVANPFEIARNNPVAEPIQGE